MPTQRRTIALFLDGYDESLERRLAADGLLPHLTRLRAASARYLLDYGSAQRSGLAGEHVSTGRDPDAAGRWAAVEFDPRSYEFWQEGTHQVPFASRLAARTVVFDMPYFDLEQAPNVRGLVSWGAHDPGVAAGARPAGLLEGFHRAVGPYPADDFIYGLVWASPEQTREMGERLTAACVARTRGVLWLLRERITDWDLAMVCVSEPHSAIEGLWHGVDATHPLHGLPSAVPAGTGLINVYRAVDELIGTLADTFPDANLIVFAMGGMGPNRSDIPSMLLLPELAYRHAFGAPLFSQPEKWNVDRATGPLLGENERWSTAVLEHLPARPPAVSRGRLSLDWLRGRTAKTKAAGDTMTWMPAGRYQPFWSRMPFFAQPSFYDGRVRVNLKGRERRGLVAASRYDATCDDIEQLVRACRDPFTGEEAVDHVERPGARDPFAIGTSESDLIVVWKGIHCALEHPTLGRLGPVPFRRPGGHTGRYGMAYIRGNRVAPGDYGVRSSFDLVPTICSLLNEPLPAGLSGQTLLNAPVTVGA